MYENRMHVIWCLLQHDELLKVAQIIVKLFSQILRYSELHKFSKIQQNTQRCDNIFLYDMIFKK